MLLQALRDRRLCRTALHRIFHADSFRPGQEKAVMSILSGRDVLCLFPTGSGKSLCYQLPAVLLRGPVMVISPLIALMRDQVRHLDALGIPALCLDSMQTTDAMADNLRRIAAGEVRLIYVSPERLTSPRFLAAASACPPDAVVVDEAHCIVSWGDGFRPAYASISRFIAQLPRRPVVCAMTATADARMQAQIMQSLDMHRPRRIVLPLLRDNLTYRVLTTIEPDRTILRLCQSGEKTLIFCRTRRRTEQLAAFLRRCGIDAGHYHAGLDRETRLAVQHSFEQGGLRVLAATSAFGMGVDIPDVRRVVMDDIPGQMTDLMQQTGRAGRDRAPAEVVLLLDPLTLSWRAEGMHTRQVEVRLGTGDAARAAQERRDQRQVLEVYLSGRCIPARMAAAFGQQVKPCGRCSACLRRRQPGRKRLAPTPDLVRMHSQQLRAWALSWERRELIRTRGLPRMGFTQIDLAASVRRGQILCRGRWRGEPQARLQALLDHLDHTRHTT